MQATRIIGLLKHQDGAEDAHGNPVESWADAVPVKVYGWGPRSADGQAEPSKPNRDMVVIGLTVYAPPTLTDASTGEAVMPTPLDRFEVPMDGELYEVDGEIGDWGHGPFGWAPGLSITLRRTEG